MEKPQIKKKKRGKNSTPLNLCKFYDLIHLHNSRKMRILTWWQKQEESFYTTEFLHASSLSFAQVSNLTKRENVNEKYSN